VPIWNEHPDVAVITFTGSAEVGWQLKAASPRKRHVLELGSNTAMVVAADADLRRAVDAVVTGGYTFSGQGCVSVQRVYVEDPVAEEFTALLAAAVDKLPIGNTRDPATVVGPVISQQARDRVVAWIDEAVQGGARLAAGGSLEGACLRPTVLADVPATARVVSEEVFGPVASIRTVKSVAEGIEEVNSARYGLNTAIFTSDLASALHFAGEAEAGSVLVNITPSFRADQMPYGGVKDSGQGREVSSTPSPSCWTSGSSCSPPDAPPGRYQHFSDGHRSSGAGPVLPRTTRRGSSTHSCGWSGSPSRRATAARTAHSACLPASWLTDVRSTAASWAITELSYPVTEHCSGTATPERVSTSTTPRAQWSLNAVIAVGTALRRSSASVAQRPCCSVPPPVTTIARPISR
jgi:hypothetical protein